MLQRLHILSLASACWLAACDPATAPADVNAPAAPACPAPQLSQKDWRVFNNLRLGVSLRMPKTYREKQWAVTVGTYIGATYRSGDFEDLSFSLEAPEGRSLEQHKVIRQADYAGYSECTETIARHKVIIQSFRGGGVIFASGTSSTPYAIAGVCELRPGRLLIFTARRRVAALRRSSWRLSAH